MTFQFPLSVPGSGRQQRHEVRLADPQGFFDGLSEAVAYTN
jgi:hypothetical protein